MRVNGQQSLLFLVLLTIAWALVNAPPNGLSALPSTEARVARVTNYVQLLHPVRPPQRASVNDIVDQETVVRTGKDSRAELTFSGETVVRLAAHTAFDFYRGTRGLNLKIGAALVQAPKDANGATIHMGGVAGAVAGTTVMVEYHPSAYKFLVLEGTGRLYRPGHLGDSILVHAGQMVIGNPDSAISDPVDVDIGNFMTTSRFITDFPSLRSEKSILAESQKQQREKSKRTLVETNLIIFGGGTQVSLVEQSQTDTTNRMTAAVVTPHRGSKPSPQPAPGAQ
jgi:hypothetical protein